MGLYGGTNTLLCVHRVMVSISSYKTEHSQRSVVFLRYNRVQCKTTFYQKDVMHELIVALHLHTVYSDGTGVHADLAAAGLKAGVDVLIVSDHNVLVNDVEGYTQKGKRRLLLLAGEEVHDRTASVGGNHLLIFGHKVGLTRYAPNRQQLIDQARSAGALTFLAHPLDDPLPWLHERSFAWTDWDVKGFTGIELWNQMSEFKTRSQSLLKAGLHAFFPGFMMLGPTEQTLMLWDELLLTRKHPVVAVAGSDAHAHTYHAGPFKAQVYPYETAFRSITTHIITPQPLSGEINSDRRMVYEALSAGHCFCANDIAHSTRGFRFTCDNYDGTFWMGDSVSAKSGLTLQVRAPIRSHIRLLKDGKLALEVRDREVLTYLTKEPGIYRAEVYIDYRGRHRGWIFSNPIYAV